MAQLQRTMPCRGNRSVTSQCLWL